MNLLYNLFPKRKKKVLSKAPKIKQQQISDIIKERIARENAGLYFGHTKEEEKQLIKSLAQVNEEIFSIDLDDEKDKEKVHRFFKCLSEALGANK